MNNYQLTKTNVLLGGQMKWNLQVRGCQDELCVTDFFLSPISKWINYIRPDRPTLNYSHDENIKDLYNTIRGDFFETKLDPRLSVKTPIIVDNEDDKKYEDTYCDMYDMGVSRTNFSKLGKTIQVFCPVWLEQFNENNVISFDINIFTKQIIKNEEGIDEVYRDFEITKKLTMSLRDNCDFHNQFINYFNNYIQSITENNLIGDKVINIDFNNSYMSIEGINVENGKKTNKNVSYNLPNIISRFRPLMDTDNLIITTLSDNNIVCKQLFNFNIIFDIEDIISHNIFKQLIGKELYFEVICKVDGVELPIKSFSYDYSKNFKIKNSNPDVNTLEFFEDYNAIQLIDKNKLSPQIIHWSSVDDNNYIFNLYPEAVWNTNLWGTKVTVDNLCLHWCNNDLMFSDVDTSYKQNGIENKDNNLLFYIQKTPISRYSLFKPGKTFINNIFYINDINESGFSEYDEAYFYINVIDNLISGKRINEVKDEMIVLNLYPEKTSEEVTECGYIYNRSDNFYNILIDKSYVNSLAFSNLLSIPEYKDSDGNIKGNADRIDNSIQESFKLPFSFSKFLNNGQYSKIITISNSVVKIKQDSPTGYTDKTTEINYGKMNIPNHYVFRQDGQIKPTFVDFEECKHYMVKKITKQEYKENWDNLIKTKFPILYPSIGYFYIEEDIKENDFCLETRWYNDSSIYVLSKEIKFTITKNINNSVQTVDDDIKSLLKNYYNIYEDKAIDYIYNLYNINKNFDYLNKHSLYDYKYNITMTLK